MHKTALCASSMLRKGKLENYSATATFILPYDRLGIEVGSAIPNLCGNDVIISALANCDKVIASFYWKPLGDSLLALSALQACQDYLTFIRPNDQPDWIIDSTNHQLLKQIPYLNNAQVIRNATSWFIQEWQKGSSLFLVTDDDPFYVSPIQPVFNTEEYHYPEFVEINIPSGRRHYTCKPAREYIVFELEVATKLNSEPCLALPDFITPSHTVYRSYWKRKYGIDPDVENNLIGIVSVAGEPEKRYGTLNYLRLIRDELIEFFPDPTIVMIVNSNQESPHELMLVQAFVNETNFRVVIVEYERLDVFSYMFARCKFVIGNDTGLSHLAAMSRTTDISESTDVFILYSKYDYGKWCTGKSNVHAIPSEFSHFLRFFNASPGRDQIDLDSWGEAVWASKINKDEVIDRIKAVLL